MGNVLAISSQVARGHVGLSAIVPVLQALGHEVIALPTVLLSNHPGHAHAAGTRVDPAVLGAMLDALDAGGWLAGIDAVLTGYLPSTDHVALAARAVRSARANSPGCLYLCDPILGDDPKGLYVAREAADAIGAQLLPLADCATPNRFELGWLTGRDVKSEDDAIRAARALGPRTVFATSVPFKGEKQRIGNLRVEGEQALIASTERRERVPHGTGDMMSALILSQLLAGADAAAQLALPVGVVAAAIAASIGRDEIALVAARAAWMAPMPVPVTAL